MKSMLTVRSALYFIWYYLLAGAKKSEDFRPLADQWQKVGAWVHSILIKLRLIRVALGPSKAFIEIQLPSRKLFVRK